MISELGVAQEVLFVELAADQRHGKGAGVDRHVDLLQEEGQAADVVFVAVGDEDPLDLFLVFDQVVVVLDHVVDAEQFVFGEEHPAVDDHDFVLELNAVHVLADFAQSPDSVEGDFVILDI